MKRFILLSGDLTVLYGALFLALFLRYQAQLSTQLPLHLIPFSLVFTIWILTFYIFNLYDVRLAKNSPSLYSRLASTTIINAALTTAFFYLVPYFSIAPKRNLFLFLAVFSVLFFLWRLLANKLFSFKAFTHNILLVGVNQWSIELRDIIKKNPQMGYGFAGIIDISADAEQNPDQQLSDLGILQGLSRLNRTVEEQKVHTIVLSPDAYRTSHIINAFYGLIRRGVIFFNLTDFYELITGKVPLESVTQTWFLDNMRGQRKFYETVKRIGDIIGAVILGIPTLFVMPLIAFIIKWESRGPVFYRQKRVGENGKVFDMIKFRSMIANDPSGGAEGLTGPMWAKERDPRITPFGNFLRKTRINELPQLLNILKGDMSFVGPRAERPEFDKKLKKKIPFYEERYLVKPGASGWGVLHKDYYSSISDMKQRLQYDLYYIKNRSLALDIAILLKTISIVLRGGGR